MYNYKNTIEEKLQQRKQAITRLQQQIEQEKESCKAAVEASTRASEEQQNQIKNEYEARIQDMQGLLAQLQTQLEEKVVFFPSLNAVIVCFLTTHNIKYNQVAYQRELEAAKRRYIQKATLVGINAFSNGSFTEKKNWKSNFECCRCKLNIRTKS